jgi:predicted DNA-binding transcriptional regulator AlpA
MPTRTFGRSGRTLPRPSSSRRLLDWEGLKAKGVLFHRNYLRTLWEAGLFPKPIHLSARKLAWFEDEVDEWIDDKATESDQ